MKPAPPSRQVSPLRSASLLLVALALAALPALAPAPGAAADDLPFPFGGVNLGPSPLESAGTGGVETVDRALAKLTQHRRLLVIAAHPDDEDTTLLTYVARELGGESAYLSLSRGEGGQNLIGPRLGVGLGLVRSQELVSARSLDGGRQYFTRAFDFGYTRSLDETLERWPEEVLLEDVVRVIRRFRPQVIVSVFPPDERAGHGQHQAAGVMAAQGFEGAGDPGLEVEGGDLPWSPSAVYRATWWDRDSTTHTLATDRLDPWTGRTHAQTAAESRSMHRSQDMGRVQPLGPSEGRYARVEGVGEPTGDDLFAGVDTRLEAIAALLPEGEARSAMAGHLERARRAAETARDRLVPARPEGAVPGLLEALGELRAARRGVGTQAPESATVLALLDEKIRVAEIGLLAAAGVAFDAWAETETVSPGETLELGAALWNGGGARVEILGLEIEPFDGAPTEGSATDGRWQVAYQPGEVEGGGRRVSVEPAPAQPPAGDLPAGTLASWRFEATPGPAVPTTVPYFLERPMDGDLYDWSAAPAGTRGEPFGRPPLLARLRLRLGPLPEAGESAPPQEVMAVREVVFRESDQAQGEIRRPVRVVPRLEVALAQELVVLPTGDTASTHGTAPEESLELTVALRSRVEEPLTGRLGAVVPDGWTPPEAVPFRIEDPEGEATVRLALPLPAGLDRGRFEVTVAARLDEPAAPADTARSEALAASFPLVDHPHIRPTPLPTPARLTVAAAPLEFPQLTRVGYVRGASDRVPEALLDLGLPVELLSGTDLAERDLSVYDALVIGSRAYETDPDLGRANPRLLAYGRAGGLVIVQYQQYQFVGGGYAPLPLDIARPHDRVTDETAPVRLLDPEHPVFHHPNPITAQDWEGWVQERGLYFASTWDEGYRPLLAFPADPELGGDDLTGGLLVADLGEGHWVYTGLAFFRQLPAGVPGAYRLFANLLALGE